MRYLLISLLAVFLFACQQELPTDASVTQVPEHLLTKEVFTNLYYDAQQTESAVRIEVGKGGDSKEASRYLYKQLFKKYGITEADFKANLKYYSSNPAQMQAIQTEVVNRLTQKEAALTNQ